MSKQRDSAVPTIQIDNDKVIVTEWRFAPGAETGWHRHGYNYIVVPGIDGRVLIESAEGESQAEMKAGQSYYRPVGVEHNVVNANDFEFHFVEVELKV